MRARLVKIGNSKGLRLPKPILEASGLTDDIEIEVEKGRIVLMPAKRRPREGWAESIAAIGPDDEDWSDWDKMRNEFDETEWTWPENHLWPDKPAASTPISSPLTQPKAPKSRKRDPASSSRRTK